MHSLQSLVGVDRLALGGAEVGDGVGADGVAVGALGSGAGTRSPLRVGTWPSWGAGSGCEPQSGAPTLSCRSALGLLLLDLVL
jgi:hypothetical protein